MKKAVELGEMKRILGKAVSGGVEIGKAALFQSRTETIIREKITADRVEKEIWLLNHGIRKSQAQLRKINNDLQKILGKDSALIIETQYLLLKDSNLLGDIKGVIRRDLVTAEWAIKETERRYLEIFRTIPDLSFQQKGNDISDVLNRVIANLKNREKAREEQASEPIILVADDLSPSEAAKLMSRRNLLGLVLNKGGETSHTVILARSLGIPAIMDTGKATELINDDDLLILDSITGEVIVNPTPATRAEAEIKREKFRRYQNKIREVSALPDFTRDGSPFQLSANIELPFESETISDYGAKGIGLFRTEFLYLESRSGMSEEEQCLIYKNTAQKVFPNPLVIRTFDLGRDKIDAETARLLHEENPSLGLMAVRIFLKKRDLFKSQIKAILRANTAGNIRILFPMITEIEEVNSIRDLLQESRDDLHRQGKTVKNDVPVGFMIEIPAFVSLISHLKDAVDFFSVGTNDLTQYLLAVDRNNPAVSYLFDPFHPGVLAHLREIRAHTRAIGKEVTICGEMAGKPLSALMLLGMGFTKLSMNAISIPEIKRIFTQVDLRILEKIVSRLERFSSKTEVREFFIESLLRRYPKLFFHHEPL